MSDLLDQPPNLLTLLTRHTGNVIPFRRRKTAEEIKLEQLRRYLIGVAGDQTLTTKVRVRASLAAKPDQQTEIGPVSGSTTLSRRVPRRCRAYLSFWGRNQTYGEGEVGVDINGNRRGVV